jgi:hypothetical protein
MMKDTKLLACLLIVSLFFQCCNIVNPAERVPTYVRVDSFHMENNESANITAVWAYYNNNPIGVFDLPATIPVVANESGSLQLAPGIAVSGQNNQMAPYPFYTIDQSSLIAQPGKIVYYTPKTGYYPGIKQQLIADFNFGLVPFVLKEGNIQMVAVNADSLTFQPGNWAGAIFLNNVGDSSVDSSKIPLTIPPGESFIELNYNSTVPFFVALKPVEGTLTIDPVALVGINPNGGKWQKFYINVQGFATKYPASQYYLYIKAVLGDGKSNGRLLLDNIKLVTF